MTAFRLASWSPAAAVVTVTAAATTAGSGPAQVMISLQVRWSGRDWRLAAPVGGAFPASPAPRQKLNLEKGADLVRQAVQWAVKNG